MTQDGKPTDGGVFSPDHRLEGAQGRVAARSQINDRPEANLRGGFLLGRMGYGVAAGDLIVCAAPTRT